MAFKGHSTPRALLDYVGFNQCGMGCSSKVSVLIVLCDESLKNPYERDHRDRAIVGFSGGDS